MAKTAENSTWRRARSQAQKGERIQAILAAAARLHERCEWAGITLLDIGREAGFTRSNLYKYFQTKEEIYLDLIGHDLSAWREAVEERLAALPADPGAFAAAWVDTLLGNPRLTRLLSILSTTLERHVSFARLVAFKSHALAEYTRVGAAIARLFPQVTLTQATDFIWAHFALAVGMIHLLDQSELQRLAMVEAGIPWDAGRVKEIMIGSVRAVFERWALNRGTMSSDPL